MLVFITSLRHPQNRNSTSFDEVLRLLETTLKSVCNQTSDRFRVIVVCHKQPSLAFHHPQIEYLEVDLPIPSPLQQARIGMPALRRDRGCKYLLGLRLAQKYQPSHIMFFDCDDYISNQLAAWVAEYPTANGWFFQQGYLYDRNNQTLGILEDFYLYCGTSHVVRADLYLCPLSLPAQPSQEEILATVGEHYLLYILGSHRWVSTHLETQGNPLTPLPFSGAIYHVGHGENLYAKSSMLSIQLVPLTQEIRTEFSLLV
ncbi:MAG: glycosyltransferase family 2 protein [Prochloron sp. SP5CPC1]|nr:glycosyltransferase family 2 protein [Candidatus Paraprochloron terpiosi SP5CPC1]